jgi:hypothetical protein
MQSLLIRDVGPSQAAVLIVDAGLARVVIAADEGGCQKIKSRLVCFSYQYLSQNDCAVGWKPIARYPVGFHLQKLVSMNQQAALLLVSQFLSAGVQLDLGRVRNVVGLLFDAIRLSHQCLRQVLFINRIILTKHIWSDHVHLR